MQVGRLDHREGLARSLRMPDQPGLLLRIKCALHHFFDRPRLVLAQDDFPQFVVLLVEDDPGLQELQEALREKNRLTFFSKLPFSSSFQLKSPFRSRFQVTP